jgi:hypothetical protein
MISVRWVLFIMSVTLPAGDVLSPRAVTQGLARPSNQSDSTCSDEKNFSRCFRSLSMANGLTSGGFAYSENTYTGPDGEKVYFRTVHYDSRDRAVQAFDEIEKSATKTLDQAKKVNKNGLEEKLAVLELGNESQRGASIVIATSDNKLMSTQSKSSRDVEIVANQMKKHTPAP